MMDRYKEVLEVNNDDEWNAMKPMIQKVMDARRESFAGGMGRGMFGGRRGGAGGGGGDQGGGNGNGNGMRRGPGGEPSPEPRPCARPSMRRPARARSKPPWPGTSSSARPKANN